MRTVAESLFERTDHELLEAWRRGDVSALRDLVERHEAAVRGCLDWLIEDPEQRERAVDEVFTALMRSEETFSPVSGLSVWLTRRALDLGDAWRRAHATERAHQARGLREANPGRRPRPQDVVAALAELPTDFFVLVMLRHLEGRPISEIAEVVRKPERQVWAMLHQALEAVDCTVHGVPRPTRKATEQCNRVALLLLLEDEAPARERRHIAEHAERCADCRSHQWRLSTLLAFLTTIADMRRRRLGDYDTWSRISTKRGGLAWRQAAGSLRRAAVALAAMGGLAVVAAVAFALATRSPASARNAVAAPKAESTSASTASGPSEPTPSVASAQEDAWLALPSFGGDPELPGSAGPGPLEPLSLGVAQEPPAETTPEPTSPKPPEPPGMGGPGDPGDELPTRAGWSGERQPSEAPRTDSGRRATSPGPAPQGRAPRPETPRPPVVRPALPPALQDRPTKPEGSGGTLAGVLDRLREP